MYKFTLPEIPNFYNDLLRHKNVLRIVALSGGYDRDLACEKLKQNKKMLWLPNSYHQFCSLLAL